MIAPESRGSLARKRVFSESCTPMDDMPDLAPPLKCAVTLMAHDVMKMSINEVVMEDREPVGAAPVSPIVDPPSVPRANPIELLYSSSLLERMARQQMYSEMKRIREQQALRDTMDESD